MENSFSPSLVKFKLFDDPLKFYNSLLSDIENAKHYIYIETYRWGNDQIGVKFREAITAKAKEGIDIKILVDSWATAVNAGFFLKLIAAGGEVRFFKKIKFYFDFFTKNHRRNHRKLYLIDNKIVYIGSPNLTGYSINWRELIIRLEDDIAVKFKKSFLESYKIYNKYIFNKFSFKKTIHHREFEIIQDIPSIYRQQIKTRYEKLIEEAEMDVYIETPYFLPGYKLRKAMMEAAQRGVNVNVIIPEHSDVRSVDILRSRYFGMLFKSGVKILFYNPGNLHAKCFLIDNRIFIIGTPNFDYRSFRYQHEIALLGRQPEIIQEIKNHINETLKKSSEFNYEIWLKRPLIEKFFERLLIPFRHLF